VEASKRGKDEALGDPALLRVDRPDRHAGRVPSTATRIALASSSDK
jgi:hypothetical protein